VTVFQTVTRRSGSFRDQRMEIRLSRESEVPLRRQLAEQIVFLIGVGKLRPGQRLPSVRELARRLKIHHNTVSEAYQALVRRTWLVRQRGSRLVVGSHAFRCAPSAGDGLDEVINAAMRRAREEGYTLKQLRERVKKRLLAHRPDHILVIDREPGFREIMRQEIRQSLGWPVETCSQEDLAQMPGLADRAQVATPEYTMDEVEPLLPRDRPAVLLTFSTADEPLEAIRSLREPSVIAMVSVSEALLRTASGLLAPAVGRRHSYREFLLSRRGKVDLRAVDLAICDSLTMSVATGTRKVHYRLLQLRCLEYLATAVGPIPRA
jgi:DNA-binding transcriptional regulator YhcF (GntR family)